MKDAWKILAALVVVVLVVMACGTAATPTPKPTSVPPTATKPAPTPTTAQAVPTPTTAGPAATPTPTRVPPTATVALPTPTPNAVFGQFNVNPDKIGIRFPYDKPNFNLPPRKGGTLKLANNLTWPHFDVTAASAAGILGPLSPAYSKLVACKSVLEMTKPNTVNCEPGPQLAESWSLSADGKVWTFNLRKGVKWQNLPPVNGREFTADDVKYTLELFAKGGTMQPNVVLVDKVEAVDKYTVRITLKEPYPDFILTALAERYAFILPREIAERDGDFKKTIVGTGPFQVKQVFGKERIVYERNPNYFIAGSPFVDSVDYSIMSDFSTNRAAFRAGQVHAVTGDTLTPADVRNMAANTPDAQLFIAEPAFSFVLYVRLDKPPFNDVRVRRAVSMAIDRPGIIKDIWEGEGVIKAPIPWQYIFETRPGLEQLPYYKYDPAQAKKLLADAGYADGFKFTSVYYPYDDVAKQIAIWVDNLKAVGVQMTLQQVDNTSLNTALRGGTYEFAATGFTTIWSGLDGWVYANMHTGASNNFGQIKDPELDKLEEAQRVEVDQAKRIAIVKQIFQKEVEQVYRIPFAKVNSMLYHSKKLHNYTYHESMIPAYNLAKQLDFVWLDQ